MSLVSHIYSTPLGDMLGLLSPRGVCLLEFVSQGGVDRERRQVEAAHGVATAGANALTRQLGQELGAYFSGALRRFSVPIDMVGTEFQRQVWRALLQIPYGETWSYAREAAHIGRDSAVRAVASANGHNKVSIVIPCHRVIGSNGTLTGYGGGLPRKQWLLDLERTGTPPAVPADAAEFALA